ncbi:MFS transporter [Streptomyces puniciscabiei]|uniref:MFS transporter n=1 Tax=Streptomyces puniciscabiei TaxID=164348 RepID=UPI003326E807
MPIVDDLADEQGLTRRRRSRSRRDADREGRVDLQLYLARSWVSTIGTKMVQVALPFAVLAAGGGAEDVGLVLGAALIPKIVLVVFGGVTSDRVSRRTVLLTTDLVMFACQAATAVLLLTHSAHTWTLLLLQSLYGCVNAFALPAANGAVQDIVDGPGRQRANSLIRLGNNVGGVAGPSLAGILVAASSPGWAFALDAATFLAAAACMLRISAGRRPVPTGAKVWGDLSEGWRALTGTTWIWAMVASFAVYQATVRPAIYVLGPVLAHNGIGVGGWAAVLVARSVGAILAGFTLMRWKPPSPLVTASLMLVLDTVFLVALADHASLPVLLVGSALSSIGASGADTLWETELQEKVPHTLISRVSSYDWLGSLIFSPLGYILVGGFADGGRAAPTLVVIAVINLVVHLALPLLPSIRRPVAPPDPGEAARAVVATG